MKKQKGLYNTAAYMRLSRDDGDKGESNSISNQRELIRDYIDAHSDLTFSDEFIDDGYSGTDFDRPGFIEMIEKAKAGEVNCIVVKDLSRLGRNYIETGKYLEQIFPLLGVRFISITDNYDSADTDNDAGQIIIPFKNLINDAYCRDISIKIRSQLDIKRQNGKFIGSFAPYGYIKDPADKNHLVIDDYAANIVRMIYNLKIDGYSTQGIADKLNEMSVLTPMEYKWSHGEKFGSGWHSQYNPKWEYGSVNSILTNEVYTGVMVQGKQKKINYKVKIVKQVDRENWTRVEGTHEPIISKNMFDTVQRLLSLDTRRAPGVNKLDAFAGFVKCADCGENMLRRTSGKHKYFHCSTYRNKRGCTSHLIPAQKLEAAVLNAVKKQIDMLLDADKVLLSMNGAVRDNWNLKVLDDQIISLEAEINKYQDLRARIYQDYQLGVLTEEEYKEFRERFAQKVDDAKSSRRAVEDKKEKLINSESVIPDWLEEIKRIGTIETIDRNIMVMLVDHIDVISKDEIEIHFNYEDEMAMILESYKVAN